MNSIEKNAVKIVAKLAPWHAQFPSAYFVARSAIVHLNLPLPVAVVMAAIIETLGLATVRTALWAHDWNSHKRKSDPAAPVALAVVLGAVYAVATRSLVVFLEVWPTLATYAPAIFPALAVVGTLNLALISHQEQREATVVAEKAERRAARQARRQADRQASKDKKSDTNIDTLLAGCRAKREERMNALVSFYCDNPDAGPTAAGSAIGVSRQTVYTYLSELERDRRIVRENGSVTVLGRVDWGDCKV
jgi:hypothetical protein